MATEQRLKNKKLTIRLTEEMKADWDAYLALNNLKGQDVIEEYIVKLLYGDKE